MTFVCLPPLSLLFPLRTHTPHLYNNNHPPTFAFSCVSHIFVGIGDPPPSPSPQRTLLFALDYMLPSSSILLISPVHTLSVSLVMYWRSAYKVYCAMYDIISTSWLDPQ